MIKPTVGRVVWYRPVNEHIPHDASQPLAAIVTYVHSDRFVNLCVLYQDGHPQSRTSMFLIQEGDEPPNHSYCEWMPFQKGQAAKTDELERALAAERVKDVGVPEDYEDDEDEEEEETEEEEE